MNFALKCSCVVVSIILTAFVLSAMYAAVHERTKDPTPQKSELEHPMSKYQHCMTAIAHMAIATDNNERLLISGNRICQDLKTAAD